MTLRIDKYAGDPLSHINALIRRAKASWGYDDELLDLWDSVLRITEAATKERQFFLGRLDSKLVLVYSLSESSATECEMEDCWVDPDHHGQGFGRAIFEHAARQMKDHGWAIMRIESDPHAESFYRHLGAVRIGEVESIPEGRKLPVMEWRLTDD